MNSRISRTQKHQIMSGGVALWTAIVAIFFLWQLVEYRGVISLIAEWQFNVLGHSYPAFSYLAPVILLISPGLIYFWRARTRQSATRLAHSMARSADSFKRMLFAVAAAFGAVGAAFAVLGFTLPADPSVPQRIDLTQPVSSLPAEGAATIAGSVVYSRISGLTQDFLIHRKDRRFAPMTGPGGNSIDLQYFVELPANFDAAGLPQLTTMSGVLKRDALPGELLRLYRYAGYRVEEPYYVLFESRTTMAWNDFILAIELVLVALVFLVAGFLQQRRIRRLEQEMSQNGTTALPNSG